MTLKLRAHVNQGQVILDEPLPQGLVPKVVHVLVDDGRDPARPSELIQGQSGFVQQVLLDPSEDIWQND